MKAETIAIGDELVSGERLDTNSQWLSQQLAELGIRVLFHTTVGDDLEANVAVFRNAILRAELILCTGGLGPTADDLTREALAKATGKPLVKNERAWAHIQAIFARRKRKMPERNVVQAMFPEGSRMVDNPHGTAPGIDLLAPRPDGAHARIFALPGVPAEMREMWGLSVRPAIIESLGENRQIIRHREIKCFGVGESDLEQMLPDLIRRGRQPSVGITVHEATITLRVTAQAASAEECDAQIEPAIATIRECLGNLIFGEGTDELQNVLIAMLAERNQTLAAIECNASGELTAKLNGADIAGRVFRGGMVLRDPSSAKRLILASTAGSAGEVSESRFVLSAAGYAREVFHADYGIAIGPFPHPESTTGAAGDVHFAFSCATASDVKRANFGGHPHLLKARTAKQAMNLLRLHLLDQRPA